MKKTIVLLTIVLAILAAPVFAEVTASGDVDFRFGMNGDVYSEKNDNDVKVNLGMAIGEFTSVDAAIEGTNETGEENNVGGDGYLAKINQMSVTQDVTGALGVDAGFGLAVTFGISSFEPKEYQGVAGYGDLEYGDSMPDFETIMAMPSTTPEEIAALMAAVDAAYADLGSYHILDPGSIMTKLSISLADMVTVDVAMYEPGMEVGSDLQQYGLNAYGTFGMVDASFSYLMLDEDTSSIGFNAAAAPMDGLKVGAGMNVTLFDNGGDSENIGQYGLSAAYTMDALTAGVAMTSSFTSLDTDEEFADVTGLAFNVNYAVTAEATAFAGVKMPDLAGDEDLMYEVGAKYVLDGVTYSAGYTDASDYVAYPAGGEDGNVFFRVQASF